MVSMLISCGGVRTDDVVLEDCIKIPAQKIELIITENTYKGETVVYLDADVTIENVDVIENAQIFPVIKMHLLDKDGVEIESLGCHVGDDMLETKGLKKKEEFSSGGEDKKYYEDIVKKTKSVRFTSEIK